MLGLWCWLLQGIFKTLMDAFGISWKYWALLHDLNVGNQWQVVRRDEQSTSLSKLVGGDAYRMTATGEAVSSGTQVRVTLTISPD